MPPDLSPTAYLIAGPNGAGKTTFAIQFLPAFAQCREFVNADLIAAGLSPFAPETQAILAGRLVLSRIKEVSRARQNFGIETTLAERGYVRMIADWRRAGYHVVLYFLWLPNAEVAVQRVANRVSQGGHNIPTPTIRRRFAAGLRNFGHLYAPQVTSWHLCDGMHIPPSLIVSQTSEGMEIHQPELFELIQTQGGFNL